MIGVVVLIRCIAKNFTCVYVKLDETGIQEKIAPQSDVVFECQIRQQARIPKLIKLGDVIEVLGQIEQESVCLSTLVPRVLKKYDAKVSGQFCPDPGAKRVSQLPQLEKDKVAVACKYWLSDSKCRRNEVGICRFAHPDPSSEQFVEARNARLEKLDLKRAVKVHDPADPFAGHKQKRSARAVVFAKWVLEKYGKVACILDVAGGKGELSRELLKIGACERVILVDPRCNVKSFSGLTHMKVCFDSDFNPNTNIDLVVGMHIDQVTEPAIEWAVAKGVPFAVVPCCVFAELFPRNGNVTNYQELIRWLLEKFRCNKDFLPLQGRNIIVWTK